MTETLSCGYCHRPMLQCGCTDMTLGRQPKRHDTLVDDMSVCLDVSSAPSVTDACHVVQRWMEHTKERKKLRPEQTAEWMVLEAWEQLSTINPPRQHPQPYPVRLPSSRAGTPQPTFQSCSCLLQVATPNGPTPMSQSWSPPVPTTVASPFPGEVTALCHWACTCPLCEQDLPRPSIGVLGCIEVLSSNDSVIGR